MAKERPSDVRRNLITRYIADRITREAFEYQERNKKAGYAAELSRLTGFSAPHISTIKNGQKTAGEDFVAAIAGLWFPSGNSVQALEQAARAYAKESGKIVVAKHTTLPNRERALEQLGNEISADTRDYLRGVRLPDGKDLTFARWVELALAHEREIEAYARTFGRKKPPTPPTTDGQVIPIKKRPKG